MRYFGDLTPHVVGGKEVSCLSDEIFIALDPATQEPIAKVAVGGVEDINRAVTAAREAFDKGSWPGMSTRKRADILFRFAELIKEHSSALGEIESRNVGKLLSECIAHEAARAAENIAFPAREILQHTDEVFHDRVRFLGHDVKTLSSVSLGPVGVVAIITPWNSPLLLGTFDIGPALAMGNTCVIKPPVWAPLSLLCLGELANKAGIPPGVLNIVPGGIEAGEALVRHRAVDRVSFTGSVEAGRAVQCANAETRFAPVLLELGGKAANIVFDDVDTHTVVSGVAHSIFRSQGQSCVAASRLLLERSIYYEFMWELVEFTRGLKIGNQLEKDTQIGPIITREHLSRVEDYIHLGIKEGARLVLGGKRPESKELAAGNFLEPTIFEGVTSDMRIFQEEIFGPVLAVTPFSSPQEAIKLANATRYGLSSNIWTNNINRALQCADALQVGMVWVNGHFIRDLRTPFGGMKDSGVGRKGGWHSLRFFSQEKMTCVSYPA